MTVIVIDKIKGWLAYKFLKKDFTQDALRAVSDLRSGPREYNHWLHALSIIRWSFLSLFRSYESDTWRDKKDMAAQLPDFDFQPENVNIGILACGGIGDFLMLANFLYLFRKRFDAPCARVYLLYDRNKKAVPSIFGEDLADGTAYICHEALYSGFHQQFDVFMEVSRFPKITHLDVGKIAAMYPELASYLQSVNAFYYENKRQLDYPVWDGQAGMVSIIQGKKRIQQLDFDGSLGISEEFAYPMFIDQQARLHTMDKFGLRGKRLIVIVNDADNQNGGGRSNKVWPRSYCDIFFENVAEKYPQFLLCQLGGTACGAPYTGVHCDLRGLTTLEETKVLLLEAELLIGCEGGMVHLRHALHGGPSLVLFGPTDERFFGYSENKNLRGKGCQTPCEWMYDGWTTDCMHRHRNACMYSLTPEVVMEALEDMLEETEAI